MANDQGFDERGALGNDDVAGGWEHGGLLAEESCDRLI
jgi:hypothetical protein